MDMSPTEAEIEYARAFGPMGAIEAAREYRRRTGRGVFMTTQEFARCGIDLRRAAELLLGETGARLASALAEPEEGR